LSWSATGTITVATWATLVPLAVVSFISVLLMRDWPLGVKTGGSGETHRSPTALPSFAPYSGTNDRHPGERARRSGSDGTRTRDLRRDRPAL
jgi:hypothetical protein